METNLALDIFFREIARKKEMTQVVNRNSIGREYEFEVSPSGTYRIATPPSGSRVPRTTPQNRTSKETYHGPPCRYIATATTSLP
jgi:hypothetical protein